MRIIFCNIGAHNRWRYVENQMKKELLGFRDDVSFITFAEMYFYKGGKQMNKKWVGIIHDPPETHKYDKSKNIFNNSRFKKSLKCCLHLFTMGDISSEWVRTMLRKNNVDIEVTTLRHPLPNISSVTSFDFEKYKYNKNKNIVQIGNWLRKTYAVYKLKVPDQFQKCICPWSQRIQTELKWSSKRDKIKLSEEERSSVKKISKLNNSKYSQLFHNNIIFLDLYESTVNNVILEAIQANCPILVNKLPSVVEYLGDGYPMFYTDRDQVTDMLTDDNIRKAHEYLKTMDKSHMQISFFINSIKNVMT